jgi:hypothetical protein
MMFGGLNRGEEENAWTKSQECWLTPSMLTQEDNMQLSCTQLLHM